MRYYFILILLCLSTPVFTQVTADDGLEIFLEESGEGDTTLLFIHGWNLDHTFWKFQVDAFEDTYRCVVPDLPGYGASGKSRSDWSMAAYGSDIVRIIKDLRLTNVILVAHSMGGTIALEAFTQDPSNIIGIIGVENFKEVGAQPDSVEQAQMDMFYAMLEQDYAVNVRQSAEAFMFHPESPQGPKEEILSAYAAADPGIAVPVVRAAFTESIREADQLSAVKVPFALISSTNIPFNQQLFLANYGGERFRNYEINKTGHFPMYEDPEAFNEALREAIRFMFGN